jgi:hypothetical protein
MLPSLMAHDDKNRKENISRFRLAITSRLNHARRPLFHSQSSHRASAPRHRNVWPGGIPNSRGSDDKLLPSDSPPAETTPLTACFSNRKSGIRISHNPQRVNTLQISNRKKIAIFHLTKWRRHSCLCAFAKSRVQAIAPVASLAANSSQPALTFLIANARLESPITRDKSPLCKFLIANGLRFFISNPDAIGSASQHRFSFHGIIGFLCSP